MLDKLRAALPASSRDQVYAAAAAFVVLLAGLGVVSSAAAALWTGTVVATLTLLFALIHSTSPVRTSIYGLIAAVAPLATWYSLGTGQAWAAVVTFAAVLLGITKAAGHSQSYDDYLGQHRAAA